MREVCNPLKRFTLNFKTTRNLKLLYLYEFVFCFGDGLFFFLLPVYIRELGASPFNVGLLFSAFYLSWAVTLLLGGFLADRFDGRKIIFLGALLWLPVPLSFAAATNWTQLWLPMILYGTYFGNASVCVYVLRSAPQGKTMQAFGFWSSSIAFGYLFSPIIGGFLSSLLGKQTIFIIAMIFYAISIIPILFITRLPKVEVKESQTVSKKSFPSLLRSNRLIGLSVFFGMIIFAIFLIGPFVSQFMNDVYHLGVFNLGVVGTAASSGWIFFSFTLGKIGDKWKRTTAVLASTTVCTFSFAIIVLINNFPILCFASFLWGASHSIIGFVPGIVGSVAPEGYVGRWISVAQTSLYAAQFVAPVLGGVLYGVSPYLAFLTTISLLLVLTLFGLLRKL
jgi:MFS family permease